MRSKRSRNTQARSWPAILFVAAAIALSAATTAVSNAQFRFGDDDLLYNADFAAGLDGWRKYGPGQVTLLQSDGPVVRLTKGPSEELGSLSGLSGHFAPGPTSSHIRVSAEFRTRDVAKGPDPWNTARLVVAPFDAAGSFIRGRPHMLYSEKGTNGWRRYDGIFPVGDDVATMRIELQLSDASGTIEIRNLRVEQAIAVPELAAIHRGLGWGWAVLVLVGLIWLSRRLPKRGLWVCCALAAAILVLAAPRPRDQVVRPVLLSEFIDATALASMLPPLQ